MRLLHVVPTYLPATRYGGPIRSVHGLAAAQARRGHEVHVYTSSLDGDGRLDVPEGVPVPLDGVQVWYFRCRFVALCWLPQMNQALHRHGDCFDAMHLHSVYLWPMARAARFAHLRRIPYVISPRGMLVPELIQRRSAWAKRLWIAAVERRVLARARAIHVTSATEAEDLRRCGLALAPVVELANGVDCPELAVRRPDAGHLLFLGRLSWKKNLNALVDAIAKLPDTRLTLAGPDDEGISSRLLDRARQSGCGERVRYVGAVDAHGRSKLFAQAQALVLPSLNENFGNVVIEALAEGCPAVVTPGVGARSIVEAGGAGWVARSADTEGLATVLSEALTDKDEAQRRGECGARYVRAHLGWDQIADQMVEVYRRAG